MFKFSTFILGILMLVAMPASADWASNQGQVWDGTQHIINKTQASPQLEDATIPDCTASDALIVSPDGSGGDNEISGVDFAVDARVYCFVPGNYTGYTEINPGNSEGTENSRRWLMYYDEENPETGWSLLDSRRTHPYQRSSTKRAVIRKLTLPGTDSAGFLGGG